MRALLALLVGTTLLTARVAAAAIACGQEVEKAAVTLSGDLDCTGHLGAAVILINAKLKLNGFTVRGGEGIKCAASCDVTGPGVVEQSSESGIWSNLWFKTRYRISKVTIRNNALWGVAGFVAPTHGQSTIVLRDSLVESNGLSGIFGDSKISVVRSVIRDNGTLNGGAGVAALHGSVIVSNSEVAGNLGEGIVARDDARVRGSTIKGNSFGGVVAGFSCFSQGRALVVGSEVTENTSPACTAGDCADVASCRSPRVLKSTCDTSHQIASGSPGTNWNACRLD